MKKFTKRECEYLMNTQEILTEEILLSVASFYGGNE